MSMPRGVFLNSEKSICSIYESGVMCYNVLQRSDRFVLDYCETRAIPDGYDFVIVNYHMTTNNWATAEALAAFGKPSFCIITEVAYHLDDNPIRYTPDIFNYYIVLDPTIRDNGKWFAFPRPLEGQEDVIPYADQGHPVIGSFGFPTVGKRWDLIVKQANEEFDTAVVRFNIPPATYVPDNDRWIASIREACEKQITKPGVRLVITTDVMSKAELIRWCSQNTVNCFFYYRDTIQSAGLAAVTDQAITSGRPLLITHDKTFRHIVPYLPTFPNIGIAQAIASTQDGVNQMQRDWHPDVFRTKFVQLLVNCRVL